MSDAYLKKWFCGPYDWELYFRISNDIVPAVLKDAIQNDFLFYIYGGKAVDAMNKSKPIGSPDWDIKCENFTELAEFIRAGIQKQLPSIELVTDGVSLDDNNPGIQIGIITQNERCKKLYVVDVFYKERTGTQELINIDGLPYISPANLIVDLRETVHDRREAVRLATLNLDEGSRIIFLREKEQHLQTLENYINTTIDTMIDTLSRPTHDLSIVIKKLENIKQKVEDVIDLSKDYGRIQSYPNSLEVQYNDAQLAMRKDKLERTEQRLNRLENLWSRWRESDPDQ